MNTYNTKNTSFIYLVPFLIFLTFIGVSILQPDTGEQVQQSSTINQLLLLVAYLLAFKLLLKKQGLLTWVFYRTIPFNILLFLILISLLWTDFPRYVIMTFFHNIGTALISFCMVYLLLQNKDYFFKLLLIFLCVYIIVTIAVTLIKPDIGLMTSSNIYSITLIGRWRGLTSHPNILGEICLFITWVCLGTLFFTKNNNWISTLAIFTLAINFYCLYKTNSMTSIILSVALICCMTWFSVIEKSVGVIKFLKIMFALLILIIAIVLLFIFHPEVLSEKYFFNLIGRDESLSGRIDIWKMGIKGYEEKPIFGWSYDNLNTYFRHYSLGFGELHNGYLDLLVKGGLVSILCFIVLIIQSAILLTKQALRKNKDYILISSLVITVLIHSVTEASILRNTNIIWLMFMIGYVYLISLNSKRIVSS
jgi:exopolysaccharide production protein ExoQ